MAEQVLLLPDGSVAVKMTVLVPTLAQVKVLGLTVAVNGPQASVVPRPITEAPMLPLPDPFNWTVALVQTATGGVTSMTVTMAEQVDVLPLPSVMVSTTVLAPRLAQVKVFGVTLAVKLLQLSVELRPMTDAPMEPFPLLLRLTVAFVQMATGGVLSTRVTLKVQVLVLPQASAAVKVMVTLPRPFMVDPGAGDCVTVGDVVQLSDAVAKPV